MTPPNPSRPSLSSEEVDALIENLEQASFDYEQAENDIERALVRSRLKMVREEIRAALLPAPHIAGGWQPTHRHKKRGSEYQKIGVGKLQIGQSNLPLYDMAELVIYQARNGVLWARPVSEFEDGRFELLPPTPVQGDAPQFYFGNGSVAVDTGTWHGKPAVFIAPAKNPGEPGTSAKRENIPLDRLIPGEVVWGASSPEHAQYIADALCNVRPVQPLAGEVRNAVLEEAAIAQPKFPDDWLEQHTEYHAGWHVGQSYKRDAIRALKQSGQGRE